MCGYYRRIALALLLSVIMTISAGAETLASEHLQNRAISFLDLLDQGYNEEAWLTMSELFQAINSQVQWQDQQQAIRTAYGPLISRQFSHISYRQSYNLSPDGQHVIILFKSSYLNKADTTETVVFDCSSTPDCSIREYIIR